MKVYEILQFIIFTTFFLCDHVIANQSELIIGQWKNTNIQQHTRYKTIKFKDDGRVILNNETKLQDKWKIEEGSIIIRPRETGSHLSIHLIRLHSIKNKTLTMTINTGYGYWDEKFYRTSVLRPVKAFTLPVVSNYKFFDQNDLVIGKWKNKNIVNYTRYKMIEFKSDGTVIANNDSKLTDIWKLVGNSLIIGDRPKITKSGQFLNNRTIKTITENTLTIQIDTGYGAWDEIFVRTSQFTLAPKNIAKENFADYKLSIKKGHLNPIHLIRFSPDGKRILSSSNDNTLILWDKETGRQIKSFYGFSCNVTLNYLGAGKPYLGTGSAWRKKKKNVKGIPCEKKLLKKFIGKGTTIDSFNEKRNTIDTIAFSPNGKYIVSGGNDENLTLYNAKSGKVLVSYNSEKSGSPLGSIKYANFSPSSKLIVTAGGNQIGEIGIWNVKTSELLVSIKTDSNKFAYIGFLPKNDQFILSAENPVSNSPGVLRQRDASNGKIIHSYTGHSAKITSVNISKNGKYIISGDDNGEIILWEINTKQKVRSIKVNSNPISALEFTPNGQHVIVSAGTIIQQINLSSSFTTSIISDESIPVAALSLSIDGKHIALSLMKENKLSLLDISARKKIRAYTGKAAPVGDVRYSSDGKIIEMYSTPPRYWDLSTGREGKNQEIKKQISARNKALKKRVSSPFKINNPYGPNGKWQITTTSIGGLNSDRFILENRATGRRKCNLQHPYDGIYNAVGNVIFSRNGNYIIGERRKKRNFVRGRNTGDNEISDTSLFIWDVKTCNVVDSFTQKKLHLDLNVLLDSPDGKYVLMVNDKRNLVLYDVADPIQKIDNASYDWPPGNSRNLTEKYTFQSIKGSLGYSRFSKDSKRLLTGGSEVEITIWDVATGKKMASILPLSNGKDSIVYTPDNYYISTKHAFDALSISKGNESYSFEQFDLRLNRPDIVLQQLSHKNTDQKMIDAYKEAYLRRLTYMKFTESMLSSNYHAPEIIITNEGEIPASTSNKIVTINITANDSLYELDKINVWVNDIPIYGGEGLNLQENNSNTVQRSLSIPLSQGENKIKLSVVNSKAVESKLAEKYIILTETLEKPDLYIIAIGASKYRDATENLKYAAKDASDLISVFKSQNNLYKNIHIHKLIDHDVTRKNIMLIRKKLMTTNIDDRVLLFYAGHGLLDNNRNYFLATYNMDFDNPSKYGLAYNKLESIVDGIPARYKIALIDSCHSGEVNKDRQTIGLSNSFSLMQELFTNLHKRTGTTVISSASGEDYAYEDKQWNNGAFSYCLFDGLQNNKIDANGDNKTMVSELQGYLLKCVSKLTDNLQKPTSRAENISNDYVFWQ